jgi:hypothetical protein
MKKWWEKGWGITLIIVGAFLVVCFVMSGVTVLISAFEGEESESATVETRADVVSTSSTSSTASTTRPNPVSCIEVSSGEPLTAINENLDLYYSLGKYAMAVEIPEDKRTFGFPVYIVAVTYSKDVPATDGVEIEEGVEMASYATRVINDNLLNQVAPIDDQANYELTPGLYMTDLEGNKSNGQQIAEDFWKSKWEKRAKECLKAKY